MPDLRALVRQAIEDRRDGFLEGDDELEERIMEIFAAEHVVPVKRTVIGGRDE